MDVSSAVLCLAVLCTEEKNMSIKQHSSAGKPAGERAVHQQDKLVVLQFSKKNAVFM